MLYPSLSFRNGNLWTPAQLGALIAWYDASDASTITLNGSTVSQWDDKSGNSRHISQATASQQPTYTLNGLSGKPIVDFDKLRSTFLQGSFPTSGISIISIFAITKWQTTGTTTNDIQTLIDNDHTSSPLQGFVWQDRPDLTNKPLTVAHIPNITAGAIDSAQTGNNTWTLISSIFESGVGDTLFINSQQRPFVSNNGVFNLQPILSIGRWANGTRYFDGEFAEIIFTAEADTNQRQKIEGYLGHKWGLTANLPSGHPYKTKPPTA